MIEELVPPGRYKSQNGIEYYVIGEVKDTDTGEIKILYKSLYDDYYCKDLMTWLEPAYDIAGNEIERYTRISE